jgi:outer membrane protein assembly factor BamB
MDGTIYVGCYDASDSGYAGADRLCAFKSDGSLKWKSTELHFSANIPGTGFSGSGCSTPAIAADGTLYVGSGDSKLYAISSSGQTKWIFPTAGAIFSSPVVAASGTIYVRADDGYLYAIGADGKENWKIKMAETCWKYDGCEIRSSPTIGAAGNVFAVGTKGTMGYLYKLHSDGAVEWGYDEKAWGTPAIGPDGTVIVGDGNNTGITALAQDGAGQWTAKLAGDAAIDTDGRVVAKLGYYYSSAGFGIGSVDKDGDMLWQFKTEGKVGAPAIGGDGTAYFGSQGDGYVYAVDSGGLLKWKFDIGYGLYSSAAIGADGTVYFSSYKGYLYAFGP